MEKLLIDGETLTVDEVIQVARHGRPVGLAEEAVQKIQRSREYVDRLVDEGAVVYGVTTGFGNFGNISIPMDEVKALQRNLIISHACGVGRHFTEEIVRAMMLLRANALSKGFSGIRLETVATMLDMINAGVYPAIPEKGSLGASGDLVPLAHMVLPLIGMGEAYYKGALYTGEEAMRLAGLAPVELAAKEGLALINGTQAMTAVGLLTAYDALCLSKICDVSAGLTLEVLEGITDPFIRDLHEIRPHKGQLDTAENLLRIVEESANTTRQGELRIQDAYSLRCLPQIHGASKDAIQYVLDKIQIEINSVTDNPIILSDMGAAISGGNFHGQPMALAFDFLGIAIAELANACERRIERLVNTSLGGLPAFLTKQGGLNSGFMITQYTAAALVSENKVLAHPASVDSIPSSANQEDHVSMGTIAACKAREIYFNASRVIAIELFAASQGIDLRVAAPDKGLGRGTRVAYEVIRSKIPLLDEDDVMYTHIERAAGLITDGSLLAAVETAIGELK